MKTGIRKNINAIILVVMLGALFVPALQKTWGILNIEHLKGAYTLAKEPEFNWNDFFEGTFQKKYEEGLQDNIDLKSLLVRINNQIDFSLFAIPHAEGVIVGKSGYLYESPYIDSYLGRDYAGETYIDEQLRKLRYLQDEFKKKGKDVLCVIAPGKGSFYPEYIPDWYDPEKRTITNYDYYIKRIKDLKINCVDFKKYFDLMKDTASYTLYPKCSIHWSTYGYTFAQDSLIRYIEKMRNIDLPDMVITGLDFPDSTRNTDYDIGEGLNLLWRIKFAQTAYPRVVFKNKEKKRVKVLTMGDSFYSSFYAAGIFPNVFDENGFWYYNKEIMFGNGYQSNDVAKLNLENEIEKNELILLFVTERNLGRFPYCFIDNVYDLYSPILREERVAHYEQMIKNDPVWINAVAQEANINKVNVNDYVRAKAGQYLNEEYKVFMKIREDRLAYGEKCIFNSPDLMKAIVKKIANTNVSIKEMVAMDARWLYENNEVELSPKKKELKNIEDALRGNAELMKQIQEKAAKGGISVEEMLMKDAFYLYNQKVEAKAAELRTYEDRMKGDPVLYAQLVEKAKKFNMSIEQMIKADALFIYNEVHTSKK